MGTFISGGGNVNGTVNTVAMFTPNSFSAGDAPIKISPVNTRPVSTNAGTNSIVGGYNNTVTGGTLDNMIFGYNISSGGSNTFYSLGHDNSKSGLVGSDIMLLGFFNNFTNQGSNIVTLGSNNNINGISSISQVIGFFNTVTAPDRSVIQGYQNNITGALLSSIVGSNNTSTGSAQYVNIIGSSNSTASSDNLSFVGAFNNISNSLGVSITGDNSIITASTSVRILGNANTVDASTGAFILGENNTVDTSSSTVSVFGVSNTLSTCSDVTVIGQTNNVISASSKVFLGAGNNGFQIEETTARMKLGPFSGALTFGLEIATSTMYFNTSTITLKSNCNFIFNTAAGTRFGTATNQRLSFWNAAPIVQPINTVAINDVLTTTGLQAANGDTILFNAFATPLGTASTNISSFRVNGATKTWATGALTNQYWNYLTANTAAFAGASTITNSYGLFVEPAIAGTNATITNNYAAGFDGNILINTGSTKIITGEVSAGNTGVWMNVVPSSTNYFIQHTGTIGIFNAPYQLQFRANNSIAFNCTNTQVTFGANIAPAENVHFILGTSIGSKIGTSTSQKLGFWNATPIVRPTTAVTASTFVANAGTAINSASTFDGYTIAKVVKALRNIGLLA